MEPKIKIVIVDDNLQFRENLKRYIESELNCIVVAEASNGEEFLSIQNDVRSDIILMDIAMEKLDGFETTKIANWRDNNLKIIAVTMHIEKVVLLKLLETGFKGCVFKSEVFNQLPEAIKTVMDGKLFLPKGIPII